MPNEQYFDQLAERVLYRIEAERIVPNLANHDKTVAHTDLSANYFEGLEAAVFARIATENEAENAKNNAKEDKEKAAFAQQKPTFSVIKTNKKIWWSAATAVAAILVGVLVLKPKTATETADLHAPLSTATAQLFAQINTSEAVLYLQENAAHLDETILENKLKNAVQNDFSTLKNEEIADFVNENDIEL